MSQTIAVFTISLSKNKKIILSIIREFILESLLKKTKKKTLDSKMCCLICFPCFRFKFCHAEQRKENDPHCTKRSFRLCIQQHVTKKKVQKKTQNIQATITIGVQIFDCMFLQNIYFLSCNVHSQLAAMVSYTFETIFPRVI